MDASIDAPPAGTDAPAPGTDAQTCPDGFVTVLGAPTMSRYKVFGRASYDDAVATCAALGTHLLQLDTQAEADALEQWIDDASTTLDTHIYRVVGRRDPNPDPDRWVGLDGVTALTFLPWGAGEPTSFAGEDCMSLRKETGNPAVRVIGADVCATLHELACECE